VNRKRKSAAGIPHLLSKGQLAEYLGVCQNTASGIVISPGFPRQIYSGYWSRLQVRCWLAHHTEERQEDVDSLADTVIRMAVNRKKVAHG
jgi:hypothetical protein